LISGCDGPADDGLAVFGFTDLDIGCFYNRFDEIALAVGV
jgi:hypothetical protein